MLLINRVYNEYSLSDYQRSESLLRYEKYLNSVPDKGHWEIKWSGKRGK